MTLDEAIKHCEEKAEELKKDADYFDAPHGMDTSARTNCLECAEEHEQLAEWLKELKQLRNQTSWIPVSERLPEYSGLYLISLGDFVSTLSFDGTGFRNSGGVRIEVYAWQPLPEPYNEEE